MSTLLVIDVRDVRIFSSELSLRNTIDEQKCMAIESYFRAKYNFSGSVTVKIYVPSESGRLDCKSYDTIDSIDERCYLFSSSLDSIRSKDKLEAIILACEQVTLSFFDYDDTIRNTKKSDAVLLSTLRFDIEKQYKILAPLVNSFNAGDECKSDQVEYANARLSAWQQILRSERRAKAIADTVSAVEYYLTLLKLMREFSATYFPETKLTRSDYFDVKPIYNMDVYAYLQRQKASVIMTSRNTETSKNDGLDYNGPRKIKYQLKSMGLNLGRYYTCAHRCYVYGDGITFRAKKVARIVMMLLLDERFKDVKGFIELVDDNPDEVSPGLIRQAMTFLNKIDPKKDIRLLASHRYDSHCRALPDRYSKRYPFELLYQKLNTLIKRNGKMRLTSTVWLKAWKEMQIHFDSAKTKIKQKPSAAVICTSSALFAALHPPPTTRSPASGAGGNAGAPYTNTSQTDVSDCGCGY